MADIKKHELYSQSVFHIIQDLKDDHNFYRCYELCKGITLEKFMSFRKKKKLKEKEARLVIYALLESLQALLDCKYVHRNINPQNILLNFHDLDLKEGLSRIDGYSDRETFLSDILGNY